MSKLQAFFSQNVKFNKQLDVIISERFIDENGKLIPWKIRSMSEKENELIRKNTPRDKKGNIEGESYAAKLVTESVVFPNLKDPDLQKSYGVMGAEDLLKEMLLSGEYSRLCQKVQEANGFDVNEMIQYAKN
ncbi:phage tail assembly chaperone [Cytobacillus praedii]|uniref:Phage portal protein n=1 Tax=Cytobacillus praedii TaxID=1742358 RepID=A0A4R1AUZ1_9BACI|nr:phage portal protein [Cytobacillus praedii]TCJ04095.1 phage portal protein [Cytobacillus praedii]